MGGYISTAAGSVTQPGQCITYDRVNIYKGGPLIVAGGVFVSTSVHGIWINIRYHERTDRT